MTHVQLDHLITGAIPYISYVCRDLEILTCAHAPRARFQVVIFEGCVGQSEPKGIEWRAFEVTISPALHAVVSERRQLIDGLVEGHRQSSARIVIAEQNLCDRGAAFL